MDAKTAESLVKAHGSQLEAAKAAGVSRHVIYRALRHGRRSGAVKAVSRGEKRTLKTFRELYDKDVIVPKRIKAALKLLGDGWEYEADFVRIAGISLGDISAYRDAFSDFVVQIGRDGRRAWAGRKSMADQMRKII